MTAPARLLVAFAAVLTVVVVTAAAVRQADAPDGYGPELRSVFVAACVRNLDTAPPADAAADDLDAAADADAAAADAEDAACRCVYDRLAAEVTFERFAQIDRELRRAEQTPPELSAARVACGVAPG